MDKKSATLTLQNGETFEILLNTEGNREVAMLLIDNVPYHFERLMKDKIVNKYLVDTDPSYNPQCDANNKCCMLFPYSE